MNRSYGFSSSYLDDILYKVVGIGKNVFELIFLYPFITPAPTSPNTLTTDLNSVGKLWGFKPGPEAPVGIYLLN